MQRLQKEAEDRSQGLPGSLEPGQSKRQDEHLVPPDVNYHLDDPMSGSSENMRPMVLTKLRRSARACHRRLTETQLTRSPVRPR